MEPKPITEQEYLAAAELLSQKFDEIGGAIKPLLASYPALLDDIEKAGCDPRLILDPLERLGAIWSEGMQAIASRPQESGLDEQQTAYIRERLVNDLRQAARVMAETGTFATGQGIMSDAADEITRLRAENERLRAQTQQAQAQANALDRGFLSVWRDGRAFGERRAHTAREKDKSDD
jgi:hypothetical protein